jgi:hypothetical protein
MSDRAVMVAAGFGAFVAVVIIATIGATIAIMTGH